MTKNLILNTDSYKLSHYKQYPPGTEYVSSYIESRGSDCGFKEATFFGLQAFLKEYLTTPITMQDIDEAEEVVTAHGLDFNREGWELILHEYGGYLPIEIKAVPEGTTMALGNVMAQVVNTDPRVPWLTSYVETALLRAVWYPTTIASNSREIKKSIKHFMDLTSDNVDEQLPFKLHDFGARGVSSEEGAMLGGMAHLVNFQGTDTLSGVMGARKYYDEPMAGFSIPASEHSTITSWGRQGEKDAYRNMIKQFAKPDAIVACVSDSYNIWRAIDMWAEMRDVIEASGATLVVRPDSGDPIEVPIECVDRLMYSFGHTVNSKGYKVLPPCVRVIQGDGISGSDIHTILHQMEKRGLAAENIAFGCGGGLLQKFDRDTLKFAMKANAICVDGEWRDVYKQPVDQQGKGSKHGRLALVRAHDDSLVTVRAETVSAAENQLKRVFWNGQLFNTTTFEEVRKRADLG